MEDVNSEAIIKNFKIQIEDKKKLLFLNNFITRTLNNNGNFNIIITIDNMSLSDINKYKKYILRVLKINNIKRSNIAVNFISKMKKIKNSITMIDFDSDDLSWRIRDNYDDLTRIIIDGLKNNNILIMTSTISLDEIKSFKKNDILDVLPRVAFHGEINEIREYKKLTKKFKDNNIQYKLKLNDFSKIVQGINTDGYVKNFSLSDYLYDYSVKNYATNNGNIVNINTFGSIIPKEEIKCDKKIDINSLVGLSNVKYELAKLFNYVRFLRNHNISRDGVYLNMFFLGNPGTGKTMIASIIADKLYELGFIEKNEVVKVIPTDLIGEYVGQTKRKIRDILDSAKGKLLFIDEAYLLCNGNYKEGNNPYMDEAIIELLKYLEDVNNITIFAGYRDEMMHIYEANPGIKSRIYKEIIFDDYSVDELYNILIADLNKKGFSVNKLNAISIKKYIEILKGDKSFGNARSMKQLAQKLIINHANNFTNGKCIDAMTITRLDIPSDNKDVRKELGFGE